MGDAHSVIFGLRAEDVERYYQEGGYSSRQLFGKDEKIRETLGAVSYTHLDVYKRQALGLASGRKHRRESTDRVRGRKGYQPLSNSEGLCCKAWESDYELSLIHI